MDKELQRVKARLDEVARERDLLRGHVKSMEKLVHEQVGRSYPSAAPAARPTSAPSLRRGSSSARGNGGRSRSPQANESGARSARKLTPAEEQEMLRRIYGKYWKMDPNSDRAGVEQLKAKLDAQERKQRMKAKEELKEKSAVKSKKMSKEEIERVSAEMFQRAKDARARLDREIAKKQESQLPEKKKSTTSAKDRAMRFQMLSLPVHKVKSIEGAAAKVWEARGVKLSAQKKWVEVTPSVKSSSASSAKGLGPRPAWFAGVSKDKEEERKWEAGAKLGRTARAGAVH